MKSHAWIAVSLALAVCAGCKQRIAPVGLHPTAAGAAIVESSGGTQLGNPGAVLSQPLVVQVNDKQGNSVTGALVSFYGPADVVFNPAKALTDPSGQVSTQVTLGGIAGRYELTASSFGFSRQAFRPENNGAGRRLSAASSASKSIKNTARAATTRNRLRCEFPTTTIWT